MFDPERLLGHLVKSAIQKQMGGGGSIAPGGGSSLGSLGGLLFPVKKKNKPWKNHGSTSIAGINPTTALLGLGALGAAYFAYRHYSEKKQATGPGSAPGTVAGPHAVPPAPSGTYIPPPPLPQTSAFPPPPPIYGMAAQVPPHTPTSAAAPVVPPLPPTPDAPPILLVRAMIAAANADHEIDNEERTAILHHFGALGFDANEQEMLRAELDRPYSMQALAQQVSTLDVARQVYAAALIAVDVDTEGEAQWLRRFAELLRLEPATVEGLHQQLGKATL